MRATLSLAPPHCGAGIGLLQTIAMTGSAAPRAWPPRWDTRFFFGEAYPLARFARTNQSAIGAVRRVKAALVRSAVAVQIVFARDNGACLVERVNGSREDHTALLTNRRGLEAVGAIAGVTDRCASSASLRANGAPLLVERIPEDSLAPAALIAQGELAPVIGVCEGITLIGRARGDEDANPSRSWKTVAAERLIASGPGPVDSKAATTPRPHWGAGVSSPRGVSTPIYRAAILGRFPFFVAAGAVAAPASARR
jgi:hypothetical protein